MNKKISELSWVVMFGGANREECVIALHEANVDIQAIVVPSAQSQKLVDAVDKLRSIGARIISVTRDGVSSLLESYVDCVLLSIGFPYIIPATVLKRHPLQLNIHPTLLPKYRGPTTAANILINGETKSGSTVHIMGPEVDQGAIVLQSEVCLSTFDTVRSLQRKVYATEPKLLIDAIAKLNRQDPLIAQEEHLATTFPNRRTPADSELDPSKALLDLVNFIRACDENDFPAFFICEGQKVCVKLWRPNKPTFESDLL
ncbi:MAG: hypothetical protein GXP16_12420 [Gammaproteobacteria bacterium]|nr:hypothetical protein [Gammaproteobacteria bacterium]